MKNLYVFDLDTDRLVLAEEWMKEEDPTRAQLFGFRTENGILLMTKEPIGKGVTFEGAQALAANFSFEGKDWKFRCITRREVIDYQDALDEGLLDLVKAIGGDVDGWVWTSERDAKDGWLSRRYSAYSGWTFNGNSGTLGSIYVANAGRCQAVTFYPTES